VDKAKGVSDEPEPGQAAASFPETQAFFGIAIKGPISAAVTGIGNSSVFRHSLGVPETHPLSRTCAGRDD